MLTPEETQSLVADGAQQVLLKCGGSFVEKSTLLECLMYTNTVINDAMHNGSHEDMTLQSEERDKLTVQAAGILFLTLQQYGEPLYTTYKLKRSLHSTQAPQKALLLEKQFMTGEVENAFNTVFGAAMTGEPFNRDDWMKLRSAIQKLGAKV